MTLPDLHPGDKMITIQDVSRWMDVPTQLLLCPGDAVEFRAADTDDWRRGVLIRVTTNWICQADGTGETWIIGNPANIRAAADQDDHAGKA